jgi:hypothetical protein
MNETFFSFSFCPCVSNSKFGLSFACKAAFYQELLLNLFFAVVDLTTTSSIQFDLLVFFYSYDIHELMLIYKYLCCNDFCVDFWWL